jgi:hypothetical protein
MTSTENEPPLLKSDMIGRVFTPPARREQLLDEFERSGLSGAKFAALTGIKYPTFAAWAQARRQQRGEEPGAKAPKNPVASARWLEAVLDKAQGQAAGAAVALRVRLPGGAQLEISHAAQVPLAAALLAALEKPARAC